MGIIDIIWEVIKALGIAVVIAYVAYMVGFIFVLRRLGRLTWLAFIPLVNYYAQVQLLGAPRRWFFLALAPYVGAVYAGSMAIRLGHVFGRGPGFSLIWLTIGAPIGMFIIAFSSQPPNKKLLDEPLVLIDIEPLKQKLKRSKSHDL